MKKNLLKTICMALVAMLCVGSLNAQFIERAKVPQTEPKLTSSIAVKADAMQPFLRGSITDDVDNHPAFMINSPGTIPWKYYNKADATYGFETVDFENAGEAMAYIVFNPAQTEPSMVGSYPAHSGAQYFACFNSAKGATNSWIVSPAFAVESNATISFWGRALTTQYGPEVFKVLISTTGDAQTNFTTAISPGTQVEVNTTNWTQYTYNIPADAKYVAINCISNDAFALFIDDIAINGVTAPQVTYCPEITNLQAEIQGKDVRLTWTAAPGEPTNYKIYNGTTSVGTTTTTDYVVTNLPVGAATLGVEAIYADDCVPVKVNTTVEMPMLLNPIKNLNGTCVDGTLNLTWTKPDDNETGYNNWLTYCASDYKGGVGIPDQPINIYWAQRWSPSDLAALGITTGSKVTKMKFVFSSWMGHEITDATYKLKIWQGTSSTSAGTEKMSQDVPFETLIEGDWNEFALDNPMEIDASLELWIGIHSNVLNPNGNPAATDNGPNVPNVNLFRTNSPTGAWTKAESITGLNSNWMVAGWVISEGGGPIELAHYNVYQDNVKLGETTTPTYTKADMDGQSNYCVLAVYDNGAQSAKVCKTVNCACEPPTNLKVEYESACTVAKLTWTVPDAGLEYKVYRGENFLEQVTTNTYTDTEFGENDTWSVKTVCGAKESEAISVTKACSGVKENAKAAFAIVPNPAAGGNITITSGNNFNKIEMISFLGQTVLSQPNDKTTATLDISNLPSGVYFVRIISEQGTSVQKFVKQ